jgi:hypothetical protein
LACDGAAREASLSRLAALFAICSGMGGKDPNRQPRLRSLRTAPAGWIRVAYCNSCRRKAPLPIDALITKYGDLAMVEFALVGLKCTACGHRGASNLMLRLCKPGCPRQRN